MTGVSNKRRVCDGCGRPEKVCLCSHLTTLNLPFDLVIWQDPDEAKHPLSSAPLIRRMALQSNLLVGDEFSFEDVFSDSSHDQVALLYPLKNVTPLSMAVAHQSIRKVLVLDGTWRKVRRLLILNPWLNDLLCLTLTPDFQSRYLRKSAQDDGVSTLEAVLMLASEWRPETDYMAAAIVLDRMTELQNSFTSKT